MFLLFWWGLKLDFINGCNPEHVKPLPLFYFNNVKLSLIKVASFDSVEV